MAGLYPNEVATDFAFLPFGGGARKCIGDQFAIMETTVIIVRALALPPSLPPFRSRTLASMLAWWTRHRITPLSLPPTLPSQAMLLRQFDFTLHGPVEDVGMRTGATIHTEGEERGRGIGRDGWKQGRREQRKEGSKRKSISVPASSLVPLSPSSLPLFLPPSLPPSLPASFLALRRPSDDSQETQSRQPCPREPPPHRFLLRSFPLSLAVYVFLLRFRA